MKYLLLIVLLPLSLFAQESDPDCGWYGNKTVEQRNMLFPFNVAKKVVLVSYPCLFASCLYDGDIDTAMKKYNGIRRLDTNFEGYKRTYVIREEVELGQASINQISNVLANYTFKERPKNNHYKTSGVLCYEPRNAILFYDENNILICCYEICFQCGGTIMVPDPDNLDEFAEAENCVFKRLGELKTVFRKNGIKHGIDEL